MIPPQHQHSIALGFVPSTTRTPRITSMCLTVSPKSQLNVSTRSTLTELRFAVAIDSQLVFVGFSERLDVEERLAAAAFHVEHVGEHILFSYCLIFVDEGCLLLGPP